MMPDSTPPAPTASPPAAPAAPQAPATKPPKKIKVENTFMPESAQFLQWIDKEESGFGYWEVPFPSKTIPDFCWLIQINMETRLMTCNCPAFIGGTDKNGKPFPGKRVCSHVKRLRWICSKMKPSHAAVSLEAMLNLSEEWVGDQKLRILNEVARLPSTCDELEVKLGLKHQTCSPLINWLWKKGFLEESGDMRPTRAGPKYLAIVWQAAFS